MEHLLKAVKANEEAKNTNVFLSLDEFTAPKQISGKAKFEMANPSSVLQFDKADGPCFVEF